MQWGMTIGIINLALAAAVYLSARALPDRAMFRSFLLLHVGATIVYLAFGGWQLWMASQQVYVLGALLALAESLRQEEKTQLWLLIPLAAVFLPVHDPLLAYQWIRMAGALAAAWVGSACDHHTRWGWLAWGYGICLSDVAKAFGMGKELLTWCDPMVWTATCLVWIVTMKTPGMELMEGWREWKTSIQSHC